MQPKIIVTLVHGTFAEDAAWLKPGSLVYDSLVKAFPGQLSIEPFRWSGTNNLYDRLDAGLELAGHIQKLQDAHPDACQFVIGHSHGGNVAIYALRRLIRGHKVLGVACLATPFIHTKPRDLAPFTGRDFRRAITALCALLLMMIDPFLPIGFIWRTILVIPALILGNLVGAVLDGIFRAIFRAIQKPLEDIAKFTSAFVPGGVNLLIVRGVGDEASLALGVGQFLSWIASRVYTLLARSQDSYFFMRIKRNAFPRWLRNLWISVGALYAIFILVSLFQPAADLVPLMLLGLSLVGIVLASLLTIATKTTLLDFVFFALALVGFVITSSLTNLWFGTIPSKESFSIIAPSEGFVSERCFRWIAGLAMAFAVEVNTEVTPSGTWTVMQLDHGWASTHKSSTDLIHGIYGDPRSPGLICDWMARCLQNSGIAN